MPFMASSPCSSYFSYSYLPFKAWFTWMLCFCFLLPAHPLLLNLISGFKVTGKKICLAPWCGSAFILHFWDPGMHVWWWLYSSPVNSFWNIFTAGCYPLTKDNDLSRTLSQWHSPEHVCTLREKFHQWTQRPNSFWMLRFGGILDAVLHKRKRNLNLLGNAVLAISANRLKTDPGMYGISRACMTGTGQRKAWKWPPKNWSRWIVQVGL